MPRQRYPAGDEPGRLARADVLSSAEGRFVPIPGPGVAAGPASSGLTEMIMRSLTRRLAVLAAAAALTVTAAACSGTTQASNSGATSGASPAASAGQAFPVSIAAANGRVKVASRSHE